MNRKSLLAMTIERQGGRCLYCKRFMLSVFHRDRAAPLYPTREHRVPRVHGGRSHDVNIAASCNQCNGLKGDMPEELFVAIREELQADPRRKWELIERFYARKFGALDGR